MKISKLLLSLLVVSLIAFNPATMSAAEVGNAAVENLIVEDENLIITPFAVNIRSINPHLSINSSGTANISAFASVYNQRQFTLTVTLQRRWLFGWTNMQEYQVTATGSYNLSRTTTLSTWGNYRVRAVVVCNGEQQTAYSGTISY